MIKTLLAKKGWRVYHANKEWSSIWKHKYLYNAPSLSNFLKHPNVISPSTIWGAMQGVKTILVEGCTWKIGNGQRVRFWDDSWIMDHALIEDFGDRTHIEQCKQLYGVYVENYWESNSWVNLSSIR